MINENRPVRHGHFHRRHGGTVVLGFAHRADRRNSLPVRPRSTVSTKTRDEINRRRARLCRRAQTPLERNSSPRGVTIPSSDHVAMTTRSIRMPMDARRPSCCWPNRCDLERSVSQCWMLRRCHGRTRLQMISVVPNPICGRDRTRRTVTMSEPRRLASWPYPMG